MLVFKIITIILGPIEVTPDNQVNSIRFMIPSSRENLNRFYNATFTLTNSAGSATSNIELIASVLTITHNINIIPSYIHVLMMYRILLITFKMNQLLSLLTTSRILRHIGGFTSINVS